MTFDALDSPSNSRRRHCFVGSCAVSKLAVAFTTLMLLQLLQPTLAWVPSLATRRPPIFQPLCPQQHSTQRVAKTTLRVQQSGGWDDLFNDDEEERRKVRVPRRGRSSRRDRYQDDDEDERYDDDDVRRQDFSYRDDVEDYDGYTSRKRASSAGNKQRYYDEGEQDDDDDDYYWDDEDDNEFDLEDRDVLTILKDRLKDGDLFSDVLIPNSELDAIDPDGAAERFPELAADPRFWFDVALFFAVISFLSDIGPRNPYYYPWENIPLNGFF